MSKQESVKDEEVIELLSEAEAAEILRVKPKTLQAWRFYKTGPAFYKVGRLIRYRLCDLHEFLRTNRVA